MEMKILTSVVILATLIVAQSNGQCTMDRTSISESLDKEKFQGVWYATSWYYHGTGESKAPMLENVQTVYTLRSDGNWNITFAIGMMEGMCYRNPAMATVDKTTERKIWVFDFYLHQILATDYENFAVLYQCKDGIEYCVKSSTQLVVLSRKPTPSTQSKDAIDKAVKDACIDLSDMIEIKHTQSCLCHPEVIAGAYEACELE